MKKTKRTQRQAKTRLILGLDPSSAATGWALVSPEGPALLEAGTFRLKKKKLDERLLEFRTLLTELLKRLKPDVVAAESPFIGRLKGHAASALYQIRAVIVLVCTDLGIPLVFYTPKEARKIALGQGSLRKEAVAQAMRSRFGKIGDDHACDAACVALAAVGDGR